MNRCVGLFALYTLIAIPAWADLFSPGELHRSHESLEGLGQCTQCHPAGEKLSQASCLDCHIELKPSVAKGQGFHGRIPSDKRNCESCHHEHRGRDAPLVDWGKVGKKSFDHRLTGWQLKGRHAQVSCATCHDKRLVKSNAVLKLFEVRQSYLGLPTECVSCHFDEHRGQVSQQCETCHTENDWKVTPGFRHDDTEYPLTGKHQTVLCKACHPAERDDSQLSFPAPKAASFLKLNGLEFKSCLDCHKDPHEDRLGQRCQSCHTTKGWKIVKSTGGERAFHEKTNYPLRGEHADVECRSCHGPFPGQSARYKNLAYKQCSNCHFDAHVGQIRAAPTPDCDQCHSVDGFLPASYSVSNHERSTYPLRGSHAAVSCGMCHEKSSTFAKQIPKATQAKLRLQKRKELISLAQLRWSKPLEKCETCHENVHGDQFAAYSKGCTSCHQVESFHKTTFDHSKNSRYPLLGRHAKVECGACHTSAGLKQPVRYRPLSMECSACHDDVHLGQFQASDAKAKCETCHTVDDFRQTLFRHEKPFTDYAIDGEHAKLKCDDCHQKVKLHSGKEVSRYKPIPRTCEGCHADHHEGAFRGFEP